MSAAEVKQKIITSTETKQRLLDAATSTHEELFVAYSTNPDGYHHELVDLMRERYGRNTIDHDTGPSLIKRIIESFVNPFTIVLFVLAIISLFTDVIMAAPDERSYVPVIIVLSMVSISGILRFVQETNSGNEARKLSEMVETTIAVKRYPEGVVELPIDELVVGDILVLAAGDMIPADVRLLQVKDLFVSQSALTGESEPVEKYASRSKVESRNALDHANLAFMGTNVISGSATAIVIAVGTQTLFGSLAKEVTEAHGISSFEKGVNSVSWVLIRFMMIMVPCVLLINGFRKGDWMEAFLFALSVAVGLTPEMLPMIVSTNLAKGAVSMSKEKVITKRLNSIQSFGAMDVLCTDKTGTITQDKIILEYYLDTAGNEDDRVLRHAFLNSYHQTGLRNLMDVAIIAHANDEGMSDLWQDYRKVDEIPFDFNRRRMSVVVEDTQGKTQLITKGAIEEMLGVCTFVEKGKRVVRITDQLKTQVMEQVYRYNEDGLRVLGIAQKTNPAPAGAFSVTDESDMVLMGFLAFLDPPKESTAEAIAALREYGVSVKILTGDNDAVTRCVCRQVGLDISDLMLGSEVELLTDEQLERMVEEVDVFAKLSPSQKVRIVAALRRKGHTVGFMGDGINDAAAMKEADVGISVDTAVDIAKESADIILLEKDLMVLERGVLEGRRTYGNIIKYIKMTASSNFGNMFSVLAASWFLPFLPMLPIQILVLNLIYDISCIAIPWDHLDDEFLRVPRNWDASSISRFMLWVGPTSSIFDITTYLLLFFVVCPAVIGQPWGALSATAAVAFGALFHAGWFVESLWTQTLVIHMIRSPKIPFLKTRASWQVTVLTTIGIITGTVLPFTPLGRAIGLAGLPWYFFGLLLATLMGYMIVVTIVKRAFIKRYGELL